MNTILSKYLKALNPLQLSTKNKSILATSLAKAEEASSTPGQQGPKGDKGEDGQDGAAAGFGTPVATIEMIDAGSPAEVTVTTSGPDTAKVFTFNFKIPSAQ